MTRGFIPRWVVAALLFASACGSTGTGGAATVADRSDRIVIGAFNFSESQALANLYADALERSGYRVQVLDEVASREVMEPALEQGQVDIVLEYLGTALTFLDPARAAEARSTGEAHDYLVEAFAQRGVSVLDHAPGQNRNELVVTAKFADLHSLEKISDLVAVAPELKFGGPPECPSRPLCLPGLERVYGLSFTTFVSLDSGGPATLAALTAGEVDVALLFTTNPNIETRGLVVLEDDLHLQPAENVVPVVRSAVAEAEGIQFQAVIDEVTAKLTDASLRRLNESVELEGASPQVAAADWLSEEGFGAP